MLAFLALGGAEPLCTCLRTTSLGTGEGGGSAGPLMSRRPNQRASMTLARAGAARSEVRAGRRGGSAFLERSEPILSGRGAVGSLLLLAREQRLAAPGCLVGAEPSHAASRGEFERARACEFSADWQGFGPVGLESAFSRCNYFSAVS